MNLSTKMTPEQATPTISLGEGANHPGIIGKNVTHERHHHGIAVVVVVQYYCRCYFYGF
jgi:hypothetical protein